MLNYLDELEKEIDNNISLIKVNPVTLNVKKTNPFGLKLIRKIISSKTKKSFK